MLLTIIILAAIALVGLAMLSTREVVGFSPLRLSWSLHGLAVLLILAALATRGLWFSSPRFLRDIWVEYASLGKTAQGLHSSLDYFNPIGPLLEWLFRVTLLVQPPSGSSIVLANAEVAILAFGLNIVLLRKRASPLAIALSGLIAVATALSPRDLDAPLVHPGAAMLAPYNSWGWALLVPVALRAALPLGRRDLAGALLAGITIGLMFVLKPTYAAAGLGAFMVAVAIQPRQWREGAIIAGTFALFLIAADLLLGGQVRAYLHDLSMTARLPDSGIRLQKLLLLLPTLLAVSTGSLLLLLATARKPGELPLPALRRNWRPVLLMLATGGAGTIVLMQNHFSIEATTLLLMPLIVAEWTGLFETMDGRPLGLWAGRGEWIALVLLVLLARPALDTGFVLAETVQTARQPRNVAFTGTPLNDLLIQQDGFAPAGKPCAWEDDSCRAYRQLMSGREMLLRACPGADQRIMAFSFSNPFPPLLNRKSPRATPIWLDERRSFSTEIHPTPEQMLGDVSCLMEDKIEPYAKAAAAIYAPTIRRDFTLAAETDGWRLWVRRRPLN